MFFTLKNVFIICTLSELILLREIQLLALSVTFRLSAISLMAAIALSVLISLSKFSPRVGILLSALVWLSEMCKSVILCIPMIKS